MTFKSNQSLRDEWLAEQAKKVLQGSKVLDVGAGTGLYRPLFEHCEYKSHDFAEEPGTIGRYTKLDYVSDILSIPVEDNSFDVILCTEVLEHVPEPILALKEMVRILSPGGVLLISAPLGSFLHQEPYHFYGGFTPYWYRKFLSEMNMEVTSLEQNGGFFYWFAQECGRFSALIDPRRTFKIKRKWLLLSFLWFFTLPLFRWLLPLLSMKLDALNLDNSATVGYHIVSKKRL